MSRKVFFSCAQIILLAALSIFSLRFETVRAQATVYVRADGSIEPPTAPISSVDNVTYTFRGNIDESIVVERNNTVVDGRGYAIQGEESSDSAVGIDLRRTNNVTVKNARIEAFAYGIWLEFSSSIRISENSIARNIGRDDTYGCGIWIGSSSNNSISRNNIADNVVYGIRLSSSSDNSISENSITANGDGIYLHLSSGNSISGNSITANGDGIYLHSSSGNNISGNSITANYHGVYLGDSSGDNSVSGNNIAASSIYGIVLGERSSGNIFCYNNLVSNLGQADCYESTVSLWDAGYPSGGNYWSDYSGTDVNQDGIGDTPYVINANNTDQYPLMGMFSDFNVTSDKHVTAICNSTISAFQFNGTAIIFNVTGLEGTAGFCRIRVPTTLMNATRVFVNGTEVVSNLLLFSNSTDSYLYFNYVHSTQEVVIVLELSSFFVLPLLMIMTLFAALVLRRKHIAMGRKGRHAIQGNIGRN